MSIFATLIIWQKSPEVCSGFVYKERRGLSRSTTCEGHIEGCCFFLVISGNRGEDMEQFLGRWSVFSSVFYLIHRSYLIVVPNQLSTVYPAPCLGYRKTCSSRIDLDRSFWESRFSEILFRYLPSIYLKVRTAINGSGFFDGVRNRCVGCVHSNTESRPDSFDGGRKDSTIDIGKYFFTGSWKYRNCHSCLVQSFYATKRMYMR